MTTVTTKTYLELVNATIDEAGDSLALFAPDGSDFLTVTDAMMNRFKKWVNRAWKEVQQSCFDWEWMSEQAVVNINPGIMFYSKSLVDWAPSNANPLQIFDVATSLQTIPNQTVTKVKSLTGLYTQKEPFGYVDLLANNDVPLNFQLKAGGEYFTTASSMAFVTSNWYNGDDRYDIPSISPYPPQMQPLDGEKDIVQVVIVTQDYAGTGQVTVPYLLQGTLRPSTVSPTGALGILEFLPGSNLTSFVNDYFAALQFTGPSKAVVGVYAKDILGNYYGGIVKAVFTNTGTVHEVSSYTSVVFPSGTADMETVSGEGNFTPVGPFDIQVGEALGTMNISPTAFPFKNTNQLVPMDGVITSVTQNEVDGITRVSVQFDNNLDNLLLNKYDFLQSAAILDSVSIPAQAKFFVPGLANVLGFNVNISTVLGTTRVYTFPATSATAFTTNYIHSWKSFDWGEELGVDDFVERVREVDQKSFRIIKHEDPAPASETALEFIPWESFNGKYDFASSMPSMPTYVTEDNTGRWRFYPPIDVPYTVCFDYVRESEDLVAYDDVPRGIPEEYVDILMWRALEFYGEYDEQPSVATRGHKQYMNYLLRFQEQSRPKFHFKSGFRTI